MDDKIPCDWCLESFDDQLQFDSHFQSFHETNRAVCTLCATVFEPFTRRQRFLDHVRRECRGHGPYHSESQVRCIPIAENLGPSPNNEQTDRWIHFRDRKLYLSRYDDLAHFPDKKRFNLFNFQNGPVPEIDPHAGSPIVHFSGFDVLKDAAFHKFLEDSKDFFRVRIERTRQRSLGRHFRIERFGLFRVGGLPIVKMQVDVFDPENVRRILAHFPDRCGKASVPFNLLVPLCRVLKTRPFRETLDRMIRTYGDYPTVLALAISLANIPTPIDETVVKSLPNARAGRDERCNLCHQKMEGEAKLLRCGHRYHEACLCRFKTFNSCVQCNTSVEIAGDDVILPFREIESALKRVLRASRMLCDFDLFLKDLQRSDADPFDPETKREILECRAKIPPRLLYPLVRTLKTSPFPRVLDKMIEEYGDHPEILRVVETGLDVPVPVSDSVVDSLPDVETDLANAECGLCGKKFQPHSVAKMLLCGHCHHGECLKKFKAFNDCVKCKMSIEIVGDSACGGAVLTFDEMVKRLNDARSEGGRIQSSNSR